MCVDESKEGKRNWGQQNPWEGGDTACATSPAVPVHFSGIEMLMC